jgi:hypothetical protein
MSWGGIDRGGGGCATTGGRQSGGGGGTRGGPAYRAVGSGGAGRPASEAASPGPGRRQKVSSSEGPVGSLTITDATTTLGSPTGAIRAYPLGVDILDGPSGVSDDDRTVDFDVDDLPVLPEQTSDDTALGWGDPAGVNDDRLLEDRPPHWA